MGKRADETGHAQLIGKEKITTDERAEEERSDPPSARAVDGEAREPKPVEPVTPGADDDEYEMVDLSELVDVPKERDEDIGDAPPAFEAAPGATDARPPSDAPHAEAGETPKELVAVRPPDREPSRPSPILEHSPGVLPPPVRVTKALPTSSASIPPPPRVPSRTLPPPPRTQGGSPSTVPVPPRAPISSPPDFTISGTLPPLPKPSKNWFERMPLGKQAAGAALLAAICAAGYFGAKRSENTRADPSREVAAASLPGPAEIVAIEPAAKTAAVLTLQAPETTPSPSQVATEPKKHDPRNALETEVAKAETQKSAPNPTTACTLNLNTIPASRVAIDGRDLGMTPKIGISVQPGTHVVMFENAGGKKITSAQCKAGEQKTVTIRLPI
jgi:hypothetical protein